MSFESLLAAHPRAAVYDVDDEVVVGGLLGTGETVVDPDLRLWITDLSPSDVATVEAGGPVVDAEIIVGPDATSLQPGHEVRVTDGRVYVIEGAPRVAPTPRGVHHLTYDARRIR